MHKIITPKNILELLKEKIENDSLNSHELVEDLAELAASHFGGEIGTISFEEDATDPFWIALHKGYLDEQDNPYERFEEGWVEFVG
jgi:hypothetical protein